MSSTSGLIYDWNRADGPEWTFPVEPRLSDETLRDGLQSPSVLDPPIEKKLRILHLMEALGAENRGRSSERQANVIRGLKNRAFPPTRGWWKES